MTRLRLLIPGFLVVRVQAEECVEINRDIRPILNKHSTACHGGVKEAVEMSFIYREKALRLTWLAGRSFYESSRLFRQQADGCANRLRMV
jgi:hypothetical protein